MPVKITPAMDAVLQNHQFELFLDEMVAYTRAHGRHFLVRHDDARLKEIIRAIVARAEKFGFSQRASTRLYIDLTWDLGWDCEHDPQYPWIGEIIRQEKDRSQLEQAESLYARLMDWMDKTCGEGHADREAAYALIRKAPLAELPVRLSHFETEMASCLSRLYPRRFAYAGPAAMDALIRQAREQAQTLFHFRSDTALALVALIAFLFGHAFWQNPLHEAWAGPAIIVPEGEADDEARAARRLHDGFRRALDNELDWFAQYRQTTRGEK